jgi:uncharacterized membrane protein YjgN (DUF898 family)
MSRNSGRFGFDGDVSGFVGRRLLALLITVATLGFGFPYALVMVQRWNARHLVLGGQRLVFTGQARELMRDWVMWWPCTLLTLGLYGFAVHPRVLRWIWDNTDYRALWRFEERPEPTYVRPLATPARAHLAFFTEAGGHQTTA